MQTCCSPPPAPPSPPVASPCGCLPHIPLRQPPQESLQSLHNLHDRAVRKERRSALPDVPNQGQIFFFKIKKKKLKDFFFLNK